LAKQEAPEIPHPGEEDWEPSAGLNQTPRKRKLLHIVTDHLGTPREMCAENGDVRWAAAFTTWGVVRGLRKALPANDNGPVPKGLGAYHRPTDGALALKPALEEAAYDCPIRFQGQWQDEETGLYYNRHRHYDALAGQYVSSDPIGLNGGERPQAYVETPTVWNDPLGLSPTLLPTEGKVGSYGTLSSAGKVGDNITPHHIPSSNRMQKEGVAHKDSIAINMEQPKTGGRHRRTKTYGTQADIDMKPRDALASGVRNARSIYMEDGLYGPTIRNSLQDLISQNKMGYPDIFEKPPPK